MNELHQGGAAPLVPPVSKHTKPVGLMGKLIRKLFI